MVENFEGDTLELNSVEKYTSNSGNVTWRCSINGSDETIYLRQAMRPMLIAVGIWDTLNELEMGYFYDSNITVEATRDGDFLKVRNIETNWYIDTRDVGKNAI